MDINIRRRDYIVSTDFNEGHMADAQALKEKFGGSIRRSHNIEHFVKLYKATDYELETFMESVLKTLTCQVKMFARYRREGQGYFDYKFVKKIVDIPLDDPPESITQIIWETFFSSGISSRADNHRISGPAYITHFQDERRVEILNKWMWHNKEIPSISKTDPDIATLIDQIGIDGILELYRDGGIDLSEEMIQNLELTKTLGAT